MSFQWPVDAEDLFGERYPQMVNTGLPAPDVDAVRASITRMWPDAPGGWVYEWSALAARYASEGSHQRPRWPTGGRSSRPWPTTPSAEPCRTSLGSICLPHRISG